MISGLNKSKEDYLEAVLIQIHKNGACRITDVANQLGYSKPSVSVALRKLEEEGFIEKDDWRILLTEEGRRIAERMLDKHSFFKEWFTMIGIEENVAVEEACQLEHIISDDSFHKIKAFISNPRKFTKC